MWETLAIALVVAAAAAYIIHRTWSGASKGDCSCDGGCDSCAAGSGSLTCPPEAGGENDDT
ncbi:MAG TPA: FeoB-associated Cys-rich membrane protein [Armatimonadota bacterium]|nr:FeoB-associated Cys-rich membrane protein [Armatimonadota bacterium]